MHHIKMLDNDLQIHFKMQMFDKIIVLHYNNVKIILIL
jgi:hypothetical protein